MKNTETHTALRSCVITRTEAAKEQLLRFVLDPNGFLTADLAGRLPGRGLYVLPDQPTIRKLLKRRGIVQTEADKTLEFLGTALSKRFLEGLGLARRAGALRRGLRDVTEAFQTETHSPLLLLAADTASNTREKLERLVRRHTLKEYWELLDRAQFGTACGNNGPVAVLAVTNRGMSRRVRSDALRWREFFKSYTH